MSKQELSAEKNQKPLTKVERKMQRRKEKTKARQKELKQRQTKKVTKWILVFVGILLAAVFLSARFTSQVNNELPVEDFAVTDADWVKGNRNAEVILTEYADFQCPACANYSLIVKQLSEEYGDRIGVVFRHFPLKQIHSNAEGSSIAAEAAGKQGKFWEMHDLLFERQKEWSDSKAINTVVADYAQELGLDTDKFIKDLGEGSVSKKIDANYSEAIRLGISSTPTFFLNGQKLESVRSYDQFKSVIDDALNKNP
jgi:protein-disulfide isomerase